MLVVSKFYVSDVALLIFVHRKRTTSFIALWSATTMKMSKVLPHQLVEDGGSMIKLIVTVLNGQNPFFAGMGMSRETVGWVLMFAC